MNSALFCSISQFVEQVFAKPPAAACTYNLASFTKTSNDDRVNMFPILMNILIHGAKKLYGPEITPQSITSKQYETLQLYMMSLGYQIKYNYTYKQDQDNTFTIPERVNIWFEPYTFQQACNGYVVFWQTNRTTTTATNKSMV